MYKIFSKSAWADLWIRQPLWKLGKKKNKTTEILCGTHLPAEHMDLAILWNKCRELPPEAQGNAD